MNTVQWKLSERYPSDSRKTSNTTESVSSISALKEAPGFNAPGVPWSITECAYYHSKILTESEEETQLRKAQSDMFRSTKSELELGRDTKRLAKHYRRQLAEVERDQYREALDYWITCEHKSCAKDRPGDPSVSQALETKLRNLT